MSNTTCTNCHLEIIGIECHDRHNRTICFHCWRESQDSTDGTICCPKCLGVGKRNINFSSKLGGWENSIIECETCKGAKRIPKADVAEIKIEWKAAEIDTSEIDVPF